MSRYRRLADTFAPWAGLVIGVIAVALVHQSGSEGVFNDCQAVSPGPLLVISLLGLLACAGSGFASWRSMRQSSEDARRVIAVISIGSAVLFIFAILLAMVAALVLPPCFQ